MSGNSRMRKCKSEKPNFMSDTSENEIRDTLNKSLDGNQSDYEPPSKKLKQRSIKTARTRKERLARLSRIAEKYAKPNVNEPSSSVNEKDKTIVTLPDIENVVFDNLFNSLDSNDRVHTDGHVLSFESVPIEIVEHTPFMDLQTNFKTVTTESFLESAMTRMQSIMEDRMKEYFNRIDELSSNVLLIRKQLCRLEMKTIANERSPSYMGDVNESEIFDLQKTLAREGLPLTSSSEVDKFEERLKKEPEFRRKLIALLSVLNGTSGDKNGSKIIKSIVDEIIEPSCQHLFSMTGKAGPGLPRKVAFENYTELIGIIFATCLQADKTYTLKLCSHDLTYKILKRGNAQRNRNGGEKASDQLVTTFTNSTNTNRHSAIVDCADSNHPTQSDSHDDLKDLVKLLLNNMRK